MEEINKYIQNSSETGGEIYNLIEELFPICRSITGNGVRKTMDIIRKHIPLEIHEVKSGTKVFDWTVPKEWNIKDAYVRNSKGEKVIDFKENNLHVMSYSVPVHKTMTLDELKPYLHTIPGNKDRIPYLTSYYKENWGFSLTQNKFDELCDDDYEVVIDSSLEDGSLTYGEYYIRGELEEEILLTTYTCHPSMCNDNLSGVALITFIAKALSKLKTKYSYRFLFAPETIGSITWLSRNEDKLKNIKMGLVATCVGDAGIKNYKRTKFGDAEIDKIVEKVLMHCGSEYYVADFFPWGSDERQFSSPGINLPVGSLMRSCYGFDGYHTSADNLCYMNKDGLADSYKTYLEVIYTIENNRTYLNLNPKCEPQLGKRGIYRMIGGGSDYPFDEFAMFWVLNMSDGKNSLLDIAYKSGMEFRRIKYAADALYRVELLKLV
ncbi:aminopeptidase-like protein [Clostridium acetobutylicum]|uniref:Putative polysaccharide biosynthesis protein with aminopeptidase-like domain n=1 Tax=Clostridium acetobutylicum (strain ATCC 824 / DSM 792 / JCM 1419 / IAM 19013 / LMG 5710 / NBRC 13948 / NRRL B-527 / VKM B-1787 / 2291 / W) TaxID=272562 RepID=PBPAD_CLOAB|nr:MULTISPECIES: DUF4910 domain-containing protein [Clostridium]Q97H19.1 RecName: Full=Putative polysaccharide biosynthesis protein with aminopeptidase-like domain [Clostridium acetobutylicum ATCC 824]AAK80152.1 Protein containing aminopeptidase domain [Clostridium acetobutylicum ATCC 824]ADZ21246.1 Protein containing aminopeptidase domain [Clostridium acetobutylicum EA 2018]AEI32224.1 aminopeptidase domain-containing protein [Clostridium acetobutylicum DSM 1731]AWV79422.1 DUF4910 domain-conta